MKKIVYLLICATLSINVVLAQKETPPVGSQPKDFKISEKKVSTLPNGLHTTMVQYGNVPKVSISLVVYTGSMNENANEVGLADLTGKMIEQGSLTMDFKTLSKKVAAMGGTVSVTAGKEEIYIGGSVLSEFAADFIAAIADLVRNPAFPSTELDRIKENMKRDLAVDMTVPQSIAQAKFRSAIFKDHPYGRYYSTPEMIDGFTLKKVKDFYNDNFGAKRSSLFLAGQFNEAAVAAAVNKSFGSWKAGPEIATPALEIGPQKQDTIIIDRKSAPQTTLMVGLPSLLPKDKDYMGLIVTNSLLGGSFGSRITSNIRENKGYTYSPRSTILNRRVASTWYEIADVTSEHTIDALQEIEKEINRLKSEPPSEAELKGIQNYLAGIFVLQNSSPGGIINQLQFLEKNGLPDSYLTNYVKNINGITPQQVSDITKNYIDYNKMTVVMVGDEEGIKKQVETKMPKKAF
ncbi:MAG: pitrilysin family protein [Chitinophagaceae bacterium]